MNKYFRAMYCIPCGMLKMACLKIERKGYFQGPLVSLVSPLTEITLEKNAKLRIGEGFKMRDGAKIRVRRGATCFIGKNTSINSNNMIACHERIEIGDFVQFSPNVQIYDHDHDFRDKNGLKALHYKTSPIKIGNNVWIGANAVILRGSEIGDNCVVAAGTVVKGKYPSNTLIYQKRENVVKEI